MVPTEISQKSSTSYLLILYYLVNVYPCKTLTFHILEKATFHFHFFPCNSLPNSPFSLVPVSARNQVKKVTAKVVLLYILKFCFRINNECKSARSGQLVQKFDSGPYVHLNKADHCDGRGSRTALSGYSIRSSPSLRKTSSIMVESFPSRS